jgi:hypothetical protein
MQACNLNIEVIWMFLHNLKFLNTYCKCIASLMSWMIKLVNFVGSYEIYFMIMKAKFIYHGRFDISYII